MYFIRKGSCKHSVKGNERQRSVMSFLPRTRKFFVSGAGKFLEKVRKVYLPVAMTFRGIAV